MSAAESLYRSMVADGDDPEAPRRIRVEHRGDRAVVTFDEPDRLNVLSAPRTPAFSGLPCVRRLRNSVTESTVMSCADFSITGPLPML